MRRTALRAIALVAIGLLLLVPAGCGGDDDESAEAEPAAATTTVEAEEAETEESETPDTPDFSSSAECAELAALGTKIAEAMGGAGGANVEETKELLDEMAESVPDEIQDDMEVVADAYAKIAEALEDVDLTSGEAPTPEQLQKLQEVTATVNQAEVTEASNNLTAWAQENCGSG